MIRVIFVLVILTCPAFAEPVQPGEDVTIEIVATVSGFALCSYTTYECTDEGIIITGEER